MMRGYNLFNEGACAFGPYGYFGLWHFIILAIVIIIFVSIIILKRKNKSSQNAIDLLKRMYVSGEISEEEYLKRKSVIEKV